jgi:hypothetical protein
MGADLAALQHTTFSGKPEAGSSAPDDPAPGRICLGDPDGVSKVSALRQSAPFPCLIIK